MYMYFQRRPKFFLFQVNYEEFVLLFDVSMKISFSPLYFYLQRAATTLDEKIEKVRKKRKTEVRGKVAISRC